MGLRSSGGLQVLDSALPLLYFVFELGLLVAEDATDDREHFLLLEVLGVYDASQVLRTILYVIGKANLQLPLSGKQLPVETVPA